MVDIDRIRGDVVDRLTKQPVGLLIDFGVATLKNGLRRIAND